MLFFTPLLLSHTIVGPLSAPHRPARPSLAARHLGVPRNPKAFNFWDLAARVRVLELGILIGWRRLPSAEELAEERKKGGGSTPAPGTKAAQELKLQLNPENKEAKLLWSETDELIIVRRVDDG